MKRQPPQPEILCCPPPEPDPALEARPLVGFQADEELALLGKAIGHPARVTILRMLARQGACVCGQIVGGLPLAQSTVSEHLRILKEAGLIRSQEDGARVGYCVNHDTLRRLRTMVAMI
jgi:ArsR family transcriptional regulator